MPSVTMRRRSTQRSTISSRRSPPSDWDRATPAQGWSVRDQISHLWFFDQRALMAMADPPQFEADKAVLLGADRGTDASVDVGRSMSADAAPGGVA